MELADMFVPRSARAFTAFAMLALTSGLSCQTEQEGARAALQTEQLQWKHDVEGLRQAESGLQRRFNRIAEPPRDQVALIGQRLQVQATLDGTRQSLGDMELQARQTVEEIGASIERDGAGAARSLDSARRRFADIATMLRDQVARSDRDLTSLERQAANDAGGGVKGVGATEAHDARKN